MPPLKRIWTCPKCLKNFTRKHSLTQHQQRVCNRRHGVGGALPRGAYKTFTREDGVIESQSVFGNTLTNFVLENKDDAVDLPQFLENKRTLLKHIIADQLNRKLSIKCNMKVDCVYSKLNGNDATYNFKTCNEPLYRASDVTAYITEAYQKMTLEQEEAYLKDSGLTLQAVLRMTVKVSRFMPLAGSSFLELPDKIKKQRSHCEPIEL